MTLRPQFHVLILVITQFKNMLFKYVQVQLDICRALPHMEALKHIAGYESSGMGTAKVPCNANKLSHVGDKWMPFVETN